MEHNRKANFTALMNDSYIWSHLLFRNTELPECVNDDFFRRCHIQFRWTISCANGWWWNSNRLWQTHSENGLISLCNVGWGFEGYDLGDRLRTYRPRVVLGTAVDRTVRDGTIYVHHTAYTSMYTSMNWNRESKWQKQTGDDNDEFCFLSRDWSRFDSCRLSFTKC